MRLAIFPELIMRDVMLDIRYTGEIGDLVVARVTAVESKRWKADINGSKVRFLITNTCIRLTNNRLSCVSLFLIGCAASISLSQSSRWSAANANIRSNFISTHPHTYHSLNINPLFAQLGPAANANSVSGGRPHQRKP